MLNRSRARTPTSWFSSTGIPTTQAPTALALGVAVLVLIIAEIRLPRLLRLATYRDMQALSRGIKGAATADEESMAAFLDELHARYGGGAGYLVAHGLTADELAALRDALVEP